MLKKITIVSLLMLLYSCKTISVNNETQNTTSHNIMLGVIGEDKQFVLKRDYNHKALPEFVEPVKIQLSIQYFNKSTIKAFSKAAINQKTDFTIDSLSNKPQFLKLELSDRVGVLKALNSKLNNDVKDYIVNKKDTHIITSISIALDKNKIDELMSADELFLETTGVKSYNLKAYKGEQLKITLSFNEGIVFAYQASNFCWQENDKRQLKIVDIVEQTDKCPNRTYRNAKRAKNEVDYFKF